MTIKNITYRYRNDFKAVFQCDKCGYEYEAWGYSDANYYDNVLPNAICPKCGLNAQGETEEQLKARTGRFYCI